MVVQVHKFNGEKYHPHAESKLPRLVAKLIFLHSTSSCGDCFVHAAVIVCILRHKQANLSQKSP